MAAKRLRRLSHLELRGRLELSSTSPASNWLSLLTSLGGLQTLVLHNVYGGQQQTAGPHGPCVPPLLDVVWLPPGLTRLELRAVTVTADSCVAAATAAARPGTSSSGAAAAAAQAHVLAQLVDLQLEDCSGSEQGIAHCFRFSTQLTRLALMCSSVLPPASLARIAATWPRLASLQLADHNRPPRRTAATAGLAGAAPHVRISWADPPGLSSLATMPNLKRLQLRIEQPLSSTSSLLVAAGAALPANPPPAASAAGGGAGAEAAAVASARAGASQARLELRSASHPLPSNGDGGSDGDSPGGGDPAGSGQPGRLSPGDLARLAGALRLRELVVDLRQQRNTAATMEGEWRAMHVGCVPWHQVTAQAGSRALHHPVAGGVHGSAAAASWLGAATGTPATSAQVACPGPAVVSPPVSPPHLACRCPVAVLPDPAALAGPELQHGRGLQPGRPGAPAGAGGAAAAAAAAAAWRAQQPAATPAGKPAAGLAAAPACTSGSTSSGRCERERMWGDNGARGGVWGGGGGGGATSVAG